MAAAIEGEEDKVMAKAKEIVKSLNMSTDETKDMILIFSSFDNRLSNISTLISSTTNAAAAAEVNSDPRLEQAEKVILRWDESTSESTRANSVTMLWEDSPDEAAEYLDAIDKILDLTEDPSVQSGAIVDRAEIALQSAMSRLEDEFRHILARNTIPFNADTLYGSMRRVSLSFNASNDGETLAAEDFDSICGDDENGSSSSTHQVYGHERGVSLGDDVFVDLVHPDAVEELKEIADRMLRAKYEKECCQVYSSVRRDAIDECLSILGVERQSIEEVQKVEWNSLDEKMKRWVRAMKVVVRVLLTGEKRLCEQLFEGSELIREVCFVETAKGCVMQLLNFAEAVAIVKRSPEKLFRILDMYDVLKDVLPDFELLFGDESGELVCSEAQGVLDGLGEAAVGTFVEFENAVKNEATKKPTQGGEIHPLTRYVMNYVKLLVDYSSSLNDLLGNGVNEPHGDLNRENSLPLECTSPFAVRLLSLITSLESNLEEKSKVYEDSAMQYVFLMNNILYLVQKVKGSELGKLLGDQWVRKHRGLIRQYSTSYLRASWSKALSCLKDEGIGGSTSNASKVALKERFKSFNSCFEEIYRVQTAWKVPDAQLREELRISISEKVLPAYRSFLGRFGNHLESGKHAGRYIKYTPDDLETYLSDLFEGTPGLLHHMRRKSS